jgi:hypothetical protein
MLNRCLSLIVSIAAPASAGAMLFAGAHPLGPVAVADRVACTGLGLLALTLAIVLARVAPVRSSRAESAMWSGLSLFFFVAAFASPHLGLWSIVAALALAATSVARIVAGRAPAGAPPSPIRRRIFA